VDLAADLWLAQHAISHLGKESALASTLVPDPAPTVRQRLSRAARRAGHITAGLVLAGSISLCWVFWRPWFEGNLGVVDPHRVIRSAQPTSQLGRWIDEFHLRAVLNLRGGSKADWWYESEVATVKAHAVSFYDLPLAATRRPTRRELLVLIDVLEHCPYPLLIHCKSGADRTGLASALYLMIKRDQPPEIAEKAFTLDYGHIPFLGTEHLHEPLREYASWLKERGLTHSPQQFRAWVKSDYRSADPHIDPPLWPEGPRGGFEKTSPKHAATDYPVSRASIASGPAEIHSGRPSSGP
jgi:hypothetical protein